MKHLLLLFSSLLFFAACTLPEPEYHLFFFHNRYMEGHTLEELHPVHGRMEYHEIIAGFKEAGFRVHSEIRSGNVNARAYAETIILQIDSLLANGVNPQNITIVGTSKGGYIAQYVATLANVDLNYVFVAAFQESDLSAISEINWSGRVLNIYEKSDSFGVSALARANLPDSRIKEFQDYELNTGLGHGFLFKANTGWIEPTIAWAKGSTIH